MASARQLSPQPIVVEAVVLASMALTTLAVGTALYLHAGLDLLMALPLALAAYAGMLVAHGLMRRFLFSGEMSEETAGEAVSGGEDRSEDLARRVAEALSALPREEVRAPRADPRSAVPGTTAEAEQAPAFGRRKEIPAQPRETSAAESPSPAPLPPVPSAAVRDGATGNASPASGAPSRPLQSAQAAAAPREAVPAPRGGAHRAGPPRGLPELPAARYTPPPERAVPPPTAPRPADVEMIQALIRKLADEVNAAAPVRDHRVADAREATERPADAAPQPAPVSTSASPSASAAIATARATSEAGPVAQAPAASRPASPVPAAAGPVTPVSVSRPTEGAEPAGAAGEVVAREDGPSEADIDALRRAAESMRDLDSRATGERADGVREVHALRPEGAGNGMPSATVSQSLGRISNAVAAGRIDVLLDPVVGLEDSKARHFEVSVRLRDEAGEVLNVSLDGEELRGTGAFPLIDQAKLERTSNLAHRLQSRGKSGAVFTRTSGESLIADPFLDTFADAYRAREGFASQLIMTFSQGDVRAFGPREWATLADMADLGFGFAIASVSDLDMDFEELAARGFRFLKLDAGVFLEGLPAGETFVPAEDICRHVAALGMAVIVGEIESEAVKARIFGFGVLFGQGALFGGARLVKADAVAPRDGHNGVAAA